MHKALVLLSICALSICAPTASAADWPSWRGVNSDGVSPDAGLPSSWSPEGDNLLWKADVGGRSAPVVLDGRVCVIRLAEPQDATKWQEQVVCLDEKTGEVRWDHRYNVYQTDIPHHRVGWSSPVGDPSTGVIYTQGVEGRITAFKPDGEILWKRSLSEQIGRISGFGGRTTFPVLDEDLLIVSFLTAGFGPNFIPRHRYYALNKSTGDTVWISTPGAAPKDTTYSSAVVREIDGRRLLIDGNGDGGVYALDVKTGKKVWGFSISKRGLNSSVVVDGTTVFASHSEENSDGSTAMGRLVALDASDVTEGQPAELWRVEGFTGGYASPIVDNGILYHVDNSANLTAFDVKNGEQLWKENLGIAQRASPVLGDGKLYVSDVDGQFHIFKLNGRSRPEKTDHDEFKEEDGSATQINGSPAIANGVVFFPTNNTLYAIGNGDAQSNRATKILGDSQKAPAGAAVAHIRVTPAEVVLRPGDTQRFRAQAFDDHGRLIGNARGVQWSVGEGLSASVAGDGMLTVAADNKPSGGMVVASAGDQKGQAFVAVRHKIPFEMDFSGLPEKGVPASWTASRGAFGGAELDGEKVYLKPSANQRSWRRTVYVGQPDDAGYEIAVDVRATEMRRRMPDAGLVSHRYTVAMMGNAQKLMIRTWMSEFDRFVKEIRFRWDPDVWYRMKVRVEPTGENQPTTIRAKVWPRDEAEPDAWTIEATDSIGHTHGSPGIYGYSSADIYYDNLAVKPAE